MITTRPTVLMATRNRATTLKGVLNEYCRLESPPAGWDLVIVDNGSSDRTAEVIRSFRDRLSITYCFEPIPGKNAALNTGLPHVTGDLVVFTDDDILPKTDWLVRLCEAADEHESYSIFAGIIAPRWESAPSSVIRQAIPLGIAYAFHPPGLREGPARPNNALGGNVAIRAEIFHRGYRFNTAIGPRPTSYTMGSEAELIRRLARDGETIWCCERATVEHLIPRSNLETPWILERAVRWGRCRCFFDALEAHETEPSWLGIPRWIFRAGVGQAARVAGAALSGNATGLLRARWRLHFLRGVAYEARELRRSGTRRMQPVDRLDGTGTKAEMSVLKPE
jgi:glycosyltransferase involved in cell wall biosynthesis